MTRERDSADAAANPALLHTGRALFKAQRLSSSS
jgi:hypothetical protein